jgi:hypothetical protein
VTWQGIFYLSECFSISIQIPRIFMQILIIFLSFCKKKVIIIKQMWPFVHEIWGFITILLLQMIKFKAALSGVIVCWAKQHGA